MIRTEKEFKETKKRLEETQKVIDAQQNELDKLNLPQVEKDKAMAPVLYFQEQLEDELNQYERIKQGNLEEFKHLELEYLGKFLIALRISEGISQRELANRLNVSETLVSRDEKNEYYGITTERARKISEALGKKIRFDAFDNTDRPLTTAIG
ncbi:MAG: helix-turn-helix transcriptional regulator [Candidatus Caenarcaniphilales bacterium]|nr:helix-turn-helix transcriptional regulator [Candidatus Caenarcaniphilales bacterium]